MDVLFAGMPSAAHRVPACRRIHGRTRSLRTLSTRRRSPRHCQSDLVRDEFAASLTCTRHLRQADCSALSPRDALLSHDLCPQLRAPLSHAETRCSNHTLRPHLRCYYRSALSPRDALLTLVPPSPAVPFSPSHPTADTSRDRAVAGLATAMSEYVPHAHMRVLTPACTHMSRPPRSRLT